MIEDTEFLQNLTTDQGRLLNYEIGLKAIHRRLIKAYTEQVPEASKEYLCGYEDALSFCIETLKERFPQVIELP